MSTRRHDERSLAASCCGQRSAKEQCVHGRPGVATDDHDITTADRPDGAIERVEVEGRRAGRLVTTEKTRDEVGQGP
ncbi:MAG: hypothetical protein U0234_32915 [Sandaracinus sp.]